MSEAAAMKDNLELTTEKAGVHLLLLSEQDAQTEYDLIQANATFLTHNGDFVELVGKSAKEIAQDIASGKEILFGIYLNSVMIGNASLIPQNTPGIFVVSYWLAEIATGHGYATTACRVLLKYAKEKLGAKEFYAGVTKRNAGSAALLERLGFQFVEDKGTYNRYRLKV